MAYTPTKWSNNESITAAQLNKLENGVSDAHQQAELAATAATEATAISEANAEDIANILDELDALRKAVGTAPAK